jgi:1-acyl-sn-glycerol-3-phosphate acyltransferase
MSKKIFPIIFYSGVVLVLITFIPALIMPRNISIFGGKILGHWSKFCVKFFLSANIKIVGEENILGNEKFFIACTHQSAFETFYLQAIFKGPKFILKKELIKIPVFGWYLKKIGSISIERNKITKDNLGFSDKIKVLTNNSSRPIIIFPQGTRAAVDDRSPFKKGVIRIYEDLKIKCQPVAINSGSVWPKKGKLISNKKITISILEGISPNLEGKNFIKILEEKIYNELDKIA